MTPVLELDRSARKTTLRRHEKFRCRLLSTDRDLLVYLPPGYDESPRRRYPVFYLQDGQNLFDPATAFVRGRDWRADVTADRLIRARAIEPVILVGIEHGGECRLDEYTHTVDRRRGGGGKADLYGQALVEEIIPFINFQYRTLPGREHVALGGSSLGGLVTLYLGLKYPRVFSKLAVLSPSVWWDSRAILQYVARLRSKTQTCIWLDSGTREGHQELQLVAQLCDALVRKGWVVGEDLHYAEVRGARHEERAWGKRFGAVLRYLFPR
ncbi:MAG: esterase [Acidobacteria bacterium]|nr:esterase [Acidobacteriota bacterium]